MTPDAIEDHVAKAMWDAVRWHPDMPSFAHEHSWDRDWPAQYEGLRDLFRLQARAAIVGCKALRVAR